MTMTMIYNSFIINSKIRNFGYELINDNYKLEILMASLNLDELISVFYWLENYILYFQSKR